MVRIITKEEALLYLKRKIGVRDYLKIKDLVLNNLNMCYIEHYKTYIKVIINLSRSGIKVERIKFSKNRMSYKRRKL